MSDGDLGTLATSWARIRAELGQRAVAQGLVDVAVERHDSPLGPILLGATPEGLVRVALPSEDEDEVLDELARRVSPRVLTAGREAVTQARRQLDEYFAGWRRGFAVQLDWRLVEGFRRDVLRATARIPYGCTASYRRSPPGRAAPPPSVPPAPRWPRTPCHRRPCHRVLRTGGALGAYRGGPEAKARLLELERGT